MTIQIDEKTGLSQFILQCMREQIKQFPEVRNAYLFGSRARGNWTAQSDIDVAIDAPSMTEQQFAQLWGNIDALPIAFPLDCVWLQSLKDSNLKAQILRDVTQL